MIMLTLIIIILLFLFFRGPSEIVADFGCGEAVIAQSVQNTVYSFDLVAKNKHVTACNMAKVGASKQSDSWGLTSLELRACTIVPQCCFFFFVVMSFSLNASY